MQTSIELQGIITWVNTADLQASQKQALNRLCSQVSQDELQALVTHYELPLLRSLVRDHAISLDGSFTAWTSEDLSHYYTLVGLSTKKLTTLLRDRATAVISGIPITDYDHLLTMPSFGHVPELKQFDQLENVAQVAAHLRVGTHQQHIFLQYLMALLNTYRFQVLSFKDTTTPSSEVIELLCKIDHVNHLFAHYFLDVITNRALKEETTLVFVKDCLSRVGALKAEILPKLTQVFRDTLCNPTISLEEVGVYIENFLEFHSLIQEKPLLDLLKLLGFSSVAAFKVNLKAERLKQEFIFSDDGESSLDNIRIYLQQPDLYPNLIHMILNYLAQQAQSPELMHHVYFAFCLHRVIQCIRQQPTEYETAQSLLSLLENYEYAPSSDRYVSLLATTNPGLVVAVLEKTDFAAAVTHALDKGYLPPSSPLFYAMWAQNKDRTQQLMDDLHEHHSILCHEILTLIFSDDAYVEQHQAWLTQNDSSFLKPYQSLFFLKRITIKYTTEPVAPESKEEEVVSKMTQAPSPAKDIVPLEVIWRHWVNCIESRLIISPYILSHESNRQLLIQLRALQKNIVAASLNLQQIKTLCIALALYHGGHVQASAGGFLVGPSISYPENTQWAHTLLVTLVFRIAYPNDCAEMNFQNVVEFLDLHFNDLKPLSIDVIQEQIIEDVGAATASDLEGQLSHTYKFVYIFAQLFFQRQGNTLSSVSIYPGSLLLQLPTTCLALYDAADASAQIDLPFWMSKSRRNQVLAVVSTLYLQKSLMATMMSPYLIEIDDTTIDQSFGSIMRSLGGTPQEKQQKTRSHFYFLNQLYNTYCVLNPNSTNQNFSHDDALSQVIRTPLQAILTATKNNLQTHKESIDIFYQRFKFLCEIALSCGINLYPIIQWVADQLGYNHKANQAQRDHFRTLETYFQNHEMIHPSDYPWIKNATQQAIDTGHFKSSWWGSNAYHDQLILLSQQLSESERLLQPSPPQAISPLRRNSFHTLPLNLVKNEESVCEFTFPGKSKGLRRGSVP